MVIIENDLVYIKVLFVTVKDNLSSHIISKIKQEIYNKIESFGIDNYIVKKLFKSIKNDIENGEGTNDSKKLIEIDK